MKGAFDIRL